MARACKGGSAWHEPTFASRGLCCACNMHLPAPDWKPLLPVFWNVMDPRPAMVAACVKVSELALLWSTHPRPAFRETAATLLRRERGGPQRTSRRH